MGLFVGACCTFVVEGSAGSIGTNRDSNPGKPREIDLHVHLCEDATRLDASKDLMNGVGDERRGP